VNDLHYAIVVGINRYPGIGNLSGARADAEAFADWLVNPDGGGLPPENVHKVLVTDDEEALITRTRGARPTHDEIDYALEAVRDALKAKLEADPSSWDRTRVYFYAAGHGFAPQGGEGALFMANADAESLERNIELAEYRKWWTTCAWAQEVVVLADCCRTRFRSSARGFGPRVKECEAPWGGKSSKYLIGYGAAIAKDTYEFPTPQNDDQARGYFTRALLEGFRSAKRDATGRIPATALATHVTKILYDSTQHEPFPQEAKIDGSKNEEIWFGSTLAPTKREVTIAFPADFSGSAKVLASGGRELATWDRTRPWRLELDDGLYEVAADNGTFARSVVFKVAGKTHVQV
jgi:uncharacterized caspase-like protein